MVDKADKPGRRLDNPLGALSSYTYQLSLYMISPDAYDTFVVGGRRTLEGLTQGGAGQGTGGAYLIAQSGGINNTTSQRGKGFEKDLYIENLEIEHVTGSEASQSATGTYHVKFNIIEPYSFSFTTKLREASTAIINAFPDRFGSGEKPGLNAGTRQFFILGMKFLGYDANGNLAKGKEVLMEDGQALDQNASGEDGAGLFETYYDINITGIKFKIDGDAVNYACTGVALAPNRAFGTKAGRLKSYYTLSGGTVEEMYTGPEGLFTKLNEYEKKQCEGEAKTQEFPNEYRIQFDGEEGDKELIRNASMLGNIVAGAGADKATWSTPASTPKDSGGARATGVLSSPDNGKINIGFKQDDPILLTFDTIIKSSSYMLNALQVLYKNKASPDLDTGEAESTEGSSPNRIGWYHITPIISDAIWDGLKNDWSYVTTYHIETYKTPIVEVGGTNPGVDYYGPHKRYEYWWTGQNKEILEYSQQLDNLFYNETLGNISDNENNASTSVNVATVKEKSSKPSVNAIANSDSVQQAYITSLYSPDAYAKAKIKILGDPDFFMEDHRGGPNAVYQRFYGEDGFRINANGGQVFFEIDFKEAVDYNTNADGGEVDNGILYINESILFQKYPDWIKEEIKGVSYKLLKVKSNFQDGVFTQTLIATINSFPLVEPGTEKAGAVKVDDKGDGREEVKIFSGGGADGEGNFGIVGDKAAAVGSWLYDVFAGPELKKDNETDTTTGPDS